jgi:hypothetical protein
VQLGLERFVARMKRKNPDGTLPSTLEMLTMNTVSKLKVEKVNQPALPGSTVGPRRQRAYRKPLMHAGRRQAQSGIPPHPTDRRQHVAPS